MKYRPLSALFLLAASMLVSASAWCAKPGNVLVIINDNSPVSREIGAYYAAKRKVPAKNVVHIKCTTKETIDIPEYQNHIEKPVKAHLAKKGLRNYVDYLVLTKGVPTRLGRGWSVDGLLMCIDLNLGLDDPKLKVMNPYFGQKEHFSHANYGFYLATRLDGYTAKDAKALVDHALAAKPQKGVFLLDATPRRNTEGYVMVNLAIKQAHDLIVKKGYESYLDDKPEFIGGRTGLMGYFSWGSNDAAFDVNKYKSNRFHPGAIAETAVSTSARTFEQTSGGQSLITDLIEAGVTGVKGYVSEPTLGAIADPRILFDRYLSGFNLAESFYMASRLIFWHDIVIGDPLCAPYANQR